MLVWSEARIAEGEKGKFRTTPSIRLIEAVRGPLRTFTTSIRGDCPRSVEAMHFRIFTAGKELFPLSQPFALIAISHGLTSLLTCAETAGRQAGWVLSRYHPAIDHAE